MGATAAIAAVGATGLLGRKLGDAQKKKDIAGLTAASNDTINVLNPTPPPPPPSAFNAVARGAQAMSDAARRYRRQRGAGQSSTLSNGAAGDLGTAPTFRKQLLGR